MLLRNLQKLLAAMYGLNLAADVTDFLVTDERLLAALSGSLRLSEDENLLLVESEASLDVALYLNAALLERLALADPCENLHGRNLDDFCKVLEGVSHFVYLVWNAMNNRRITKLELEMQAEVDKYIGARLLIDAQPDSGIDGTKLVEYLFADVCYRQDLQAGELERYMHANDTVGRYCYNLAQRFPAARVTAPMRQELQAFYRMPQAEKLSHINTVQFA
jgi:hypothetical protein